LKTIDIEPRDLAIVTKILIRHVPHRTVRAFGSRVSGTARRFSDLDLVVMGERPLSLSAVSALLEDFTESDLPFKVDVVDWATTKEAFREIIEKEYVVVQNE
jgi:type I restriction enzyme S subunit